MGLIGLIGPSAAHAAVLRQLPLSARLTGADSQNVTDGTYSFRFRIYSSESGSTVLWEETKNIAVEGGIFSTLLGSSTSLDSLDFNSDSYYLAIKVGTDDEMSPRKHIGSSPMALNSDRLDGSHGSTSGGASVVPMTDASGNLTLGSGTFTSGALTGSSTGSFADTLTLSKATGTGLAVTNNATVGGTLAVTSTINGATISGGTVSGGTLSATAVNGLSVASGTISSGTWQGTTIAVGYGGTGLTSYAIGDLLYASGATALSKLADVAAGSVLVSGGIGAAPSWSATPSVTSLTLAGALSGATTGAFSRTL